MSRVAATEWGCDGININVVCPLVMTAQLEQWREEYPEIYEKTIQGIPLQRFGDAEKDIGIGKGTQSHCRRNETGPRTCQES